MRSLKKEHPKTHPEAPKERELTRSERLLMELITANGISAEAVAFAIKAAPQTKSKPSKKRGPKERVFEKAELALMDLWAAIGIPHEEIALALETSTDTLTRRFDAQLKVARVTAKGKMLGSLYSRGIKGDNTAAIFWLKAVAGLRDVQHIKQEIESQVIGTIRSEPLTEEEWLAKYGSGTTNLVPASGATEVSS